MKPGEFIKEFIAKDGKHITIRALDICDIEGMLAHINNLVDEDAFLIINTKTDYISELEFVTEKIKSMLYGDALAIVAIAEGKFVAEADIRRGIGRANEIGSLGIAIAKEYRGIGLGKELMTLLLDLAKKDNYKVIKLGVYSPNITAKRLYEKVGFKVAGKIPYSKMKDKYMDEIIMYKEL